MGRAVKPLTRVNAVGLLLEEAGGRPQPAAAPVFLRRAGGVGVNLMPRGSAEALLKRVTSSPLDVTGDLVRGFAWSVPGAHPRRSYAVIPLAAPVWSDTSHPTTVAIELWWPPDKHCLRHVRAFAARADDPYSAYLLACCLWSREATGTGAEAAYLYGPNRSVAYRISEATWTCSNILTEPIARAVTSVADFVSTNPLPDSPRTASAMQTERVDGRLTFAGTHEEISAHLREHADARGFSVDVSTAYAMRNAAARIEDGNSTEYLGMSHHRVSGGCDTAEFEVA